mmetsp:Transcript_12031/g.27897  ORF Transcript_12031/g.27897 Transcript_12031/m.27897 type:complete len:221 (-) Transcript_12031:756-1418(-)
MSTLARHSACGRARRRGRESATATSTRGRATPGAYRRWACASRPACRARPAAPSVPRAHRSAHVARWRRCAARRSGSARATRSCVCHSRGIVARRHGRPPRRPPRTSSTPLPNRFVCHRDARAVVQGKARGGGGRWASVRARAVGLAWAAAAVAAAGAPRPRGRSRRSRSRRTDSARPGAHPKARRARCRRTAPRTRTPPLAAYTLRARRSPRAMVRKPR